MRHIVFKDAFAAVEDNAYPDAWTLERNAEKPFTLGAVIGDEFQIMFKGNKHIPLTPPLKNFSLDFMVAGSPFYGTMGIEIYFHYNTKTRDGWCLRYDWGLTGNKTNRYCANRENRECSLFRYRGARDWGKYEPVAAKEAPGVFKDLTRPTRARLEVNGNAVAFSHGGETFKFALPETLPKGVLAFDQSRGKTARGAFRISSLKISTDVRPVAKTTRAETKTEFPSGPNGVISPLYFHLATVEKDGTPYLRVKLTGGPAKEPLYPEINRCRFNEKTRNPYVRLETPDGKALGKFLIARGTVGLAEYNWNTHASVMGPADFECPLKREIGVAALPKDFKVFFGYEEYLSEDSICKSGGPTEALIDATGKVVYAGPRFQPGDARFTTVSPENKKVCSRIPRDIPNYQDALTFARRNHFFIESETVRFQIKLNCRDKTISKDAIKASVRVEDVFGEVLVPEFDVAFAKAEAFSELADATTFSTEFFPLPPLKVGVYHLRTRISGAALPEQRLAFEVMPTDPKQLPAPLVSGLPKLHPNILSGICNEHFHPWSHAVSDTAHYNSGGNNYFKVAREWRAAELLHVYGREWLCYLKPWKTVFAERGIPPNKDLIAQADAALLDVSRKDTWAVEHYRDPFTFDALLEFTKSAEFVPVANGVLNRETLAARSEERGLTREQFTELVQYHWKKWLLFFTKKRGTLTKERSALIREINPESLPFEFCPVYPTYGSNYKSGYFPFLFGRDLRNGIEKDLPGPNGFEDYPYSSGYPIAKGVYNLASCKLEAPGLKMYPEMFGINGETLDARVVFANPPYGQSDPPYGFLIKQFYEYSFAVTWFDRNGFNYWRDHGYSPKTWDNDNYREMLYAYAFISKVKPVKPLRTTAFVFSRDACLKHPDYHNTDEDLFFGGSVDNSAEEAVAYVYEQTRLDGQLAGFVTKMEDLDLLSAADTDTLVIPPLLGVSDSQKTQLRRLHEQGVSLLGFEDVSGLEDLFGVEAAPETKVAEILPGEHPAATATAGMSERTTHEWSVVRHRLTTAGSALVSDAGAPVLCFNETRWGKTALFALPPTFVKRAKSLCPSYGQRNNSALIDAATRLATRWLGDKEAETSAGTLIGFRDSQGAVHVIVEEDRCPEKGQPIRPLVSVKIPGVKAENISSDKAFELVQVGPTETRIRLSLNADESARIKIAFA